MPVSKKATPTITIPRANAGLGLLAMVAIAISTVALLRPQADASGVARAAPTPVATVDLLKVITELNEFKVVEAKIKEEGTRRQAEFDRLTQEVEGLEEDLKRLDPNSDAYDKTFRERNMKLGFREVTGGNLAKWQSEDSARLINNLYDKAVKAVETVAKRDGWEVVVHRGQSLSMPMNPRVRAEMALDFVENFIQTRRVIYSGESVDISNSVVQHMNNQYAIGK